MKKFILVFVALVLLFGCLQQRFESQTPEGKKQMPSEVLKTNATSIIDKVIEPLVKPEPKEVPANRTLGTGKTAISEAEIPKYDDSKDEQLEDLIKGMKK